MKKIIQPRPVIVLAAIVVLCCACADKATGNQAAAPASTSTTATLSPSASPTGNGPATVVTSAPAPTSTAPTTAASTIDTSSTQTFNGVTISQITSAITDWATTCNDPTPTNVRFVPVNIADAKKRLFGESESVIPGQSASLGDSDGVLVVAQGTFVDEEARVPPGGNIPDGNSIEILLGPSGTAWTQAVSQHLPDMSVFGTVLAVNL